MSGKIQQQTKPRKPVNFTVLARNLVSLEKAIDGCIERMDQCDLGELDGPLSHQVRIALDNVTWGLGALADKAILLAQNCRTREYTLPTIQESERIHIAKALILYEGNRTVAAEKLGISRRTMYRKIKEYGLE